MRLLPDQFEVVAALVGVVFGGMMRRFRLSVKYFAPTFFLLGYLCFATSPSLPSLLVGCLFIGIANGIGVPYLNKIASIKAGQDAAAKRVGLRIEYSGESERHLNIQDCNFAGGAAGR